MVSQRTDKCIHLEELLKCQTDLIIKHLARHKWFNEIPDEADGVADFIEKYGWLMFVVSFVRPESYVCGSY